MFLKMFNENIDDLNDVIPSLAIMRLSFMLKDIYKHAKKPNLLNEVEMQKLYINYGDKYNAIDKVVLLIYGITSINNYKIDEEKIPISRVNIESLNEKEKALYDKNELPELITPKVILETNIGSVVIGYDYAYVRKETFTPNIELTDEQKIMLDDERLTFDVNYPYISIDPDNQIITISPIVSYDVFTMKDKPKYTYEKYIIDIQKYEFKRAHSCEPIKYMEEYEIIEVSEDKRPNIDNWDYNKSYLIKEGNNEELIIEYTKESKQFQIITKNDYSISTISFDEQINEYIKEKLYFVNYPKE